MILVRNQETAKAKGRDGQPRQRQADYEEYQHDQGSHAQHRVFIA